MSLETYHLLLFKIIPPPSVVCCLTFITFLSFSDQRCYFLKYSMIILDHVVGMCGCGLTVCLL